MDKTRFGSLLSKNADSFLISLAGLFLIILYTRHGGIGISPDSIAYLSVARNVIYHGLPVDYSHRPLVDFPVMYPFFLSFCGFLGGTDPLTVATWINGILFAAVIFTTGHLIDTFSSKRRVTSTDIISSKKRNSDTERNSDIERVSNTESIRSEARIYKRVVLIVIALSPSLLEIYSMLWSETLFILLILLFFTVCAKYLENRSVLTLILSGGLVSLACITRYAGVSLIGTGLMILVFDISLPWRKKILHCLWFGTAAVSLLIVNLIRNAMITGSLTGPREAGILSLSDNIVFYGRVVCQWMALSGEQPQFVSGIAILIFCVIGILFLRRSWYRSNYSVAENCFAAFFIVYTVFIIGISTLSHFEQINNRLLSPLFIPLIIAITSWVPTELNKLKSRQYKFVSVVLLFILSGYGWQQYKQLADMYNEEKDFGIAGYTDDLWRKSETAAFLQNHPGYFNPEFDIYSNAHEAAYFNGGITAESMPHKRDTQDTADFFSEDAFYLIWFDNFSDNELIKFKTILQKAVVVKQYDFKDGDIFFVRPRHF